MLYSPEGHEGNQNLIFTERGLKYIYIHFSPSFGECWVLMSEDKGNNGQV